MAQLKKLRTLLHLRADYARKLGYRSEAEWNYLDVVLPTISPEASLASHLAQMLFLIPQVGEPITPAMRRQLQYDFNKCTAALGAALAQTGQKVAVIDFDVGLRNLDLQCMRNGLAYSVGRDYTEIMAPGNGPRET